MPLKPKLSVVAGRPRTIQRRQLTEQEEMFRARTGKQPLLCGGFWARGTSILNEWLHGRRKP